MLLPGATCNSRRLSVCAVAALVVVAMVRIVATYAIRPQAFDEPCHVAAAIELLDRQTYTLDPVHPPLARIAIGLPLYVAGERYPKLPALDHVVTYTDVGNAILYGQDRGSGHYVRRLRLARLGVLPFFVLGTALVFEWARREYGQFAGVMAAALFTTLPNVLAFSSIAYTDMVAATTQAGLFLAFVEWLDKPSRRSALWLGLAGGLALASKATTLIFFPAAVLGIVLVRWAAARTMVGVPLKRAAGQLAMALAVACVTVWGTYGFAVGHVREGMKLSAESMPTFQHFPAPLARLGQQLILKDPLVPAPALMRGVAEAWVLNKERPPAYLLGRIRPGGWWYFFLVGVAVKTPLAVLILAGLGLIAAGWVDGERGWRALAPGVAALAVLLVTMPVKYNAGVRHVMVVFPLLCILAGAGSSYLWRMRRMAAQVALLALLAWQAVSTVRAEGDFLAYFNELAGSDPSKVLVAGCDLDCGQDLFRLAREFEARHISHAAIAAWTSAEAERMGWPPFEVPRPHQPVTGWFAISARSLRFGDVFHETYPPDAFEWLNAYQPVGRVGKTIWLYYIPGR